MILAFKLTMPVAASWNGHWSGEDQLHVRTRNISEDLAKEVLGNSDKKFFGYHWSDGWFASIEVFQVDSTEEQKLIKESVGFAGYDWMIDSILAYGKIQA
jgi:hypothetical protein